MDSWTQFFSYLFITFSSSHSYDTTRYVFYITRGCVEPNLLFVSSFPFSRIPFPVASPSLIILLRQELRSRIIITSRRFLLLLKVL